VDIVEINIITLVVVTIGAIASVAVAWYTFQGPKVEVSVAESINDDHFLNIKVVNVGHRNIEINWPNILLQDGRTFNTVSEREMSDLSRLSLNGGSFPYLLITGDSCIAWVTLKDLADWLKGNNYCGDVSVRFQFSDTTGKRKYKSGKFSINVDEALAAHAP
jgi:hypothetical protein